MDNTAVLMKKCKKCCEEKPITEFYKDKNNKCGYRAQCKTCSNAAHKTFYEANKEKTDAYIKSWYEANKEKVNAYRKSWYETNKEKVNAYRKSQYEKNKELFYAKKREWKKANPELVRKYRRDRRAKKRNSNGNHTVADIMNLLSLQKSKCAVCNTSIAKGYHIDHIVPISKGGSNDKYNLQLLCAPCNLRKNAKDPIEFMQKTGFLL